MIRNAIRLVSVGGFTLFAAVTSLVGQTGLDISSEGTLGMDFQYLGREAGAKTSDRGSLSLEFREDFDGDPFLYVWGRNVYYVGLAAGPLPGEVSVDFAALVLAEGQWARVGIIVVGDRGDLLLRVGAIVEREAGEAEASARLIVDHVEGATFEARPDLPRADGDSVALEGQVWYRLTVTTARLGGGEVGVALRELDLATGGVGAELASLTSPVDGAAFGEADVKVGFFADVLALNRLAMRNFVVSERE